MVKFDIFNQVKLYFFWQIQRSSYLTKNFLLQLVLQFVILSLSLTSEKSPAEMFSDGGSRLRSIKLRRLKKEIISLQAEIIALPFLFYVICYMLNVV